MNTTVAAQCSLSRPTLTTVMLGALATLAATASPAAWSQDMMARVISSTPVMQAVTVPRQVCNTQSVVVGAQPSGGGAAIGAIAGGLIGSTLGRGNGNALATAAGVVGGALAGSAAEANSYPGTVQNVQRCQNQMVSENRITGYNVVYEFNGQQHAAFMAQDPGATVTLQVSPVGTVQSSGAPLPVNGAPLTAMSDVAPLGTPVAPAMVGVNPVTTVVTPYPAYPAAYPAPYPVYPAYYPRTYVAPVISLGWGWRPHYHHRRWR